MHMKSTIFLPAPVFFLSFFISPPIPYIFHYTAHNRFMDTKSYKLNLLISPKYLALFALGALTYFLMEILYRGYSHWSMALVAGGCILTFFLLEDFFFGRKALVSALYGAILITCYELAAGLLVNVVFKWQVWDYSDMPLNFLGQICIPYFICWYFMCFVFFSAINYLASI